MNKIKVAHLINYMSPAGKEIGIVKLLNRMNGVRFETALIVLDKVYDLLDLDTRKVRLIEMNKRRGNDVKIIWRLYRLFREERYDIVHTHAWGTLVEGVLAAKLAGVPIIIHGEHGTFHCDRKRKIFQRLFFKWADYLTCVSAVLARQIQESIGLGATRFRPILNGVDTSRFREDSGLRNEYRRLLGFDDQTLVLGTVGRPDPVKNQQLIIRALKELLPEFPDTHFVLIGDTPLSEHKNILQNLVDRLELNEHVHFLGIRKDIPGWLNAFDVFVLSSFSEGCSNVIQEAMATGLPVVASRVGGNPELIEDGVSGKLFTSDNLQELVAILKELFRDARTRKNLGKRARDKVVNNFSLGKMVTAYESLYLEIIKKRNGRING